MRRAASRVVRSRDAGRSRSATAGEISRAAVAVGAGAGVVVVVVAAVGDPVVASAVAARATRRRPSDHPRVDHEVNKRGTSSSAVPACTSVNRSRAPS